MEKQSSRFVSSQAPRAASGWSLRALTAPSVLFGANGMRVGPDGRLYVAQAFGSQVSAVDIATGAVATISPIGGAIVAPDDLVFDTHGTLYATEVMSARVCARAQWRRADYRRQRSRGQRHHGVARPAVHGRMPS